MRGHVPQYLDTERQRQRLRAERAEGHAQKWRVTAYVLLALLVVQTWLVIDTAITLSHANADVAGALTQARLSGARRIAAESDFQRCLSANAGLVDSLNDFDRTIKDQKILIGDALDLARRCDAQPTKWVLASPVTREVVW